MLWLDPTSQRVRAAVVSGAWGRSPHSPHWAAPPTDPDEIDVIADVLDQASDSLTTLTAGVVHPPCQVVEDFVCYPTVSRLTPSFQPLRGVVSLQVVTDSNTLSASAKHVVPFAGNVRFTASDQIPGTPGWLDWAQLWTLFFWPILGCECPEVSRLRLTYDAGSTITAQARAAVLSLAHELYLQVAPCDECGTCRLPLRTTSVQREGLSYQLADPLSATGNQGMTGLPDVDMFVLRVNPRRVQRPAAVYTPDAPPPVVRSVVSARGIFPPYLATGLRSQASVTATGTVA